MSSGYLLVKAIDISNSKPIKGAKVAIYYIHTKNNEPQLLSDKIKTDRCGKTPRIKLSAPSMIYSQDQALNKRPYSRYIVEVSMEGYQTETVIGVQVFPCIEAIQTVRLKKQGTTYSLPARITIEDHLLYAGYEPKIMEAEEKPTFVLSKVVIPEFIVVHDGLPTDSSAIDYWIPFKEYIKNVASSEIYATWPKSTIYANIVAIISFTLNRVYTEWYKNQGYRFTITSTTQYDHKFIYERNTFDTIESAVDDIFDKYIVRGDSRQPLLAQYCDGKQTQCPGKMTQWGSKDLGDQGFSYDRILRYFYGNDINFKTAPEIPGIATSYPGYDLTVGSRGEEVKTIQQQLNVISKNYPAIPKLSEDGIFGNGTKKSVEVFQEIFDLPVTGIVDFATWYEISRVYVAVSKIGAFN